MPLTGCPQFISKMQKQNFDLKLELFHRRQRMAVLEEEVERLRALETDNAELQEVNEQMLRELEKRDQAVQEAVGMICMLEDRVRRLEAGDVESTTPVAGGHGKSSSLASSHLSPSTSSAASRRARDARAGSQRSRLDAQLSGLMNGSLTASESGRDEKARVRGPLPRNRSSLSSKSRDAGGLRSMFLAGESGRNSTITQAARSNTDSGFTGDSVTGESEDEGPDVLDSPRLSVLSESSFLSVYGGRMLSDGESRRSALGEDGGDERHGSDLPDSARQDPWDEHAIAARIEQWIGERPRRANSARQAPGRPPRQDQFASVGDVLGQSYHRSDRDQGAVRDRPQREVQFLAKTAQSRWSQPRFDGGSRQGPMFAGGTLPPTPDTLSTIDQDSANTSSSNVTAKGASDGSPGLSSSSQWASAPIRRPRGISDLGASYHSRMHQPQHMEGPGLGSPIAGAVGLRTEPGTEDRRHLEASRCNSLGREELRSVIEGSDGRLHSALASADDQPFDQNKGKAVPVDLQHQSYSTDTHLLCAHPASHHAPVLQPSSPGSTPIRPSLPRRGVTVDAVGPRYALPRATSNDEVSDAANGYASESSGKKSGALDTASRPRLKPTLSDSSRRTSFSLTSSKPASFASKLFSRSSTSTAAARKRRSSNQDLATPGSLSAFTNAPRLLDAIGRSLSANVISDAFAGAKGVAVPEGGATGRVPRGAIDASVSDGRGDGGHHDGGESIVGGLIPRMSTGITEAGLSTSSDADTQVQPEQTIRKPRRPTSNDTDPRSTHTPPTQLRSQQHLLPQPQPSPVPAASAAASAAGPQKSDRGGPQPKSESPMKGEEGRSRIRWSLGRSHSAVLP